MRDYKRLLRKLKRETKKAGNRRRRHFLKDIHTDPDDFDFGRDRSAEMNEPHRPHRDAADDPRDRSR